MRRSARIVALAVLAFLAVLPFVALVHQAAFLVAAGIVGAGARQAELWLLPVVPVDPVYAGAGLRIVGGIEPAGLALRGPAGDVAHRLMPVVFGPSTEVAPGALVSALVAPGATVAARAICMLGATVAAMLLLTAVPFRSSRPWAVIGLAMARTWLLLGLVRETAFDLRELEATGLPFALAALSPVDAAGQRPLLTRELEALPPPVIEIVCGLVVVLVCLGVVAGLRAVATLALSRARRRTVTRPKGPRVAGPRLTGACAALARAAGGGPSRLWSNGPEWRAGVARAAGLAAMVSLVVLTPLDIAAGGRPAVAVLSTALPAGAADDPDAAGGAPDAGPLAADSVPALAADAAPALGVDASPGAAPDGAAPEGAGVAEAAAVPTAALAGATSGGPDTSAAPVAAGAGAGGPASAAQPAAGRGAGGSVVALDGGGYRYTLTVDGSPSVVRGMGYNPWYATLPPDQRRALYARDFSAMRGIGVNTVEGWFQDQFDEVTLDEAARNGLKVILPFELNHDYDYGDPAIRARFRAEITAWVLRYRDHPAVLMWGPGNEVMHRLIFPTAVQGARDAAREHRADDFAAFYVEVVDLIRTLDPDHPVIYRDAEDLYFARIRDALLRDGVRRPWFVYGTNVYTQRLAEVIRDWPSQGLDAPLLISEFSPGGVGPAERPRMLRWYWSAIRAHPERVLGGVVYTWAVDGPEDLDRVFGLTDAAGRPVDGSLAALRQLFLGLPADAAVGS